MLIKSRLESQPESRFELTLITLITLITLLILHEHAHTYARSHTHTHTHANQRLAMTQEEKTNLGTP